MIISSGFFRFTLEVNARRYCYCCCCYCCRTSVCLFERETHLHREKDRVTEGLVNLDPTAAPVTQQACVEGRIAITFPRSACLR